MQSHHSRSFQSEKTALRDLLTSFVCNGLKWSTLIWLSTSLMALEWTGKVLHPGRLQLIDWTKESSEFDSNQN